MFNSKICLYLRIHSTKSSVLHQKTLIYMAINIEFPLSIYVPVKINRLGGNNIIGFQSRWHVFYFCTNLSLKSEVAYDVRLIRGYNY